MQTFDITSDDFKREPWPTLAALHAAGPLVQIRFPLIGQVWLATRAASVSEVLKDTDRFVMDPANAGKTFVAGMKWWMPKAIRVLADNMLLKDEPDHRRLRKLVDQAFQRQDVARMQGRIREIAGELLDPFAGKDRMDIAKDFSRAFPLFVIAEILGLPEADRPKFRALAGKVLKVPTATAFLMALPNLWHLQRYFREQFELCRRTPRPGLLSAMVEAHDEGEALSDSELMAMAFLLLMAGHETTSQLISVGMLTLLQNSEQKETLMADWSGIGLATEELLRYAAPVPFSKPRHVRNDMTFHGHALKRGEYVMACLAAANVDPAHTSDPFVLDLKRKPNPHFSFGAGPHYCLGLLLARAEAQVAFQELLTRFPDMRLAVDERNLEWAGGGMRGLASLPVFL